MTNEYKVPKPIIDFVELRFLRKEEPKKKIAF